MPGSDADHGVIWKCVCVLAALRSRLLLLASNNNSSDLPACWLANIGHQLDFFCDRLPNISTRLQQLVDTVQCQSCTIIHCMLTERHFMLECPQFDDIRAQYPDLLQDARDSMRNLMWHQNQKALSDCVIAILDEPRT